ncbi:hypothetical protein DPMN_034665 [Dreissena polymorpha]|uniref:Uncharacterized protein n=1 Tax=Dreissena polymorpha TaxID=45954 RepID=A0A9D4M5W5_DREPO|nr:hypothetical protein DPMN_034665 [Dreissena polymorpha]
MCVLTFRRLSWFVQGFATSATSSMAIGTGGHHGADVMSRAQMEHRHVIELARILRLKMAA